MLEKYEHHEMTRFWLGPALFIIVNDPKLIEVVLHSPKCVEKSFFYKFLRLDKGLLAAKRKLNNSKGDTSYELIINTDDLWMEHRKCLESAFKVDRVKSFVPIFVDSSDQMLEALDVLEVTDNVDIFKFMSRCSLTIMLATSFGLSAAEVHFSDDILKAVEE